MRLEPYRHLWGVSEALETAAPAFKARGYVGLEAYLPAAESRAHLQPILRDHGLKFIAQVITRDDDASVTGHLERLERDLEAYLPMHPTMINVHAGCDAWNDADTVRFYTRALEIARRATGTPVAFETHRNYPTFTPWRTAWLLAELPPLRLTCDFSHWVTVCERLPFDQTEAIHAAARACIHLHARVGHPQGPQVPDPSDPHWHDCLTAHETWWDAIWAAQEARGDAVTTITPEFGPPDYLAVQPHSRQPLADLNGVCDWMMERQRERFARRPAAT